VYPFLFEIPGTSLRIPTYGFCLMSSFLLGYLFMQRQFRKRVPDQVQIIMGVFPWIVFSSLMGSRLFHVIFERPTSYLNNPIAIFYLWKGGHVFYGGLLAAILASYWYCRHNKISFLWFADVGICSVALAQVLARIGCFLSGCCWGKVCQLPWAVTFTHPETAAGLKHLTLHPTQLYQAAANLITFFICLYFLQRKRFNGEVLLCYGIVYPIGRFLIEIFRADHSRGFLIPDILSIPQFISLLIFTASIILLLTTRNVSRTSRSL